MINMYDSTSYVRKKKWTWFGNYRSLNFHVQVSGVSQGCQESPASLSH